MRSSTGLVTLAIVLAAAGCTAAPASPAPAVESVAIPARRHCAIGPTDLDVTAGRSTPVPDPSYPDRGNPALDVLAYQVALAWAPQTEELTGLAVLTIRAAAPVDHVALDFSPAYTVDRVFVDGLEMAWSWEGDDLAVPGRLDTDGETVLTICYHGKPAPVAGNGAGLRTNGSGSAYTVSDPYGASTWFPANELPSDKAVYQTSVTVPSGWSAVAHGSLLGVDAMPETSTFYWQAREPVAPTATALAIDRYARIDDQVSGIPLTYWLRPGRDDAYLPAVRRTPEILGWLANRFGPYPFPSAGAVVVDAAAAGPTQQMALVASDPQSDPVGQLVAAYAGQWFGAAVSSSDRSARWLAEGFAGYARALWEIDHGTTTDAAWAAAGQPALTVRNIDRAVGATAFIALARDWVQAHRYESVDPTAFTAFVRQRSGRDVSGVIAAS